MSTKILILFCFIFINYFRLNAQTEFKTKEVTVFKDGTVFFEKTGLFFPKNGEVTILGLPFKIADNEVYERSANAFVSNERVIMGSVWFSCPDNKISEIKFMADSVKQKYYDTKDLLQNNGGKFVSISISNSDSVLTGFIETVFSTDNKSDYLLLRNKNSFSQINIEQIEHINFESEPNILTIVTNIKRKIFLKLNNNTETQVINLKYLQKGIVWLPNYFIELSDDTNGKLTLNAAIINDIEDIRNIDLNLAVGIPVFKFFYVTSPFASNHKISELLTLLANPPDKNTALSNRRNIMSQSGSYHETSYKTNYETQTDETGSEDLFFYKCENVSISKGEKSNLKILEFDFKYENLYSVELISNTELYQQNRSNSEPFENTVWHSIRFANPLPVPLTTGTVFLYKKENANIKLISQNQLNYTPANEYTTAKISVSPDIWVENKEKEIEREDVNYDKLITSEATIEIANYKSKPIDLVIHRKIAGNLLKSDTPWEVYTGMEKEFYLNKTNYVLWKVTIPAKQTRVITYTYSLLSDR